MSAPHRMNSEPALGRSLSEAMSESTEWEHTDDEGQRSKRRRKRLTRSASLACHTMNQRIGLATSTLAIPVEHSSEDDSSSSSSASSLNFRTMSREKKLTVINFCVTNLCAGCFYSLLGPFFPNEAAKKGVNTTIVGLIFGAFELTLVLSSPIYGTFLTQIGAKFMYVAGVMVCGCGALLFGFLDGSPDGTIYIVMCFLVRFVEALGASALSTSSFAIMANTFPDNVATVFGSLELFTGLGLMIGPPVGGGLFQVGGFRLPFMSLGCVMILVGVISAFLLPSQTTIQQTSSGSITSILRIPIVIIMGLCIMSGSGAIGFLDVTLSLYLSEQYGLSPFLLGLVFLVGPGVYAITAPVWGWIVDKKPRYNKVIICGGYMLGGLGFYLMGPAPFLHIPHMLWLVIVSLAMMGLGISTFVIAFQVITEASISAGHPDRLETYGLIAGVFNTFFSTGAFIGPLGGGYLHDLLKFEMSAVIIGSCGFFSALVLLVYLIVESQIHRTHADNTNDKLAQETSERQPLLASGNTTLHLDSSHRNSEPTLSIKNGRILEEQTVCTRA